MKKSIFFKDNRGASLVLVIFSMLFIGIIASIVLTITVGNSKTTKLTVDSSENFYSSEGVLDDLKMYLQKMANSAAADAYVASLEKIGTDADVENIFKNEFYNKLDTLLADVKNHELDSSFLANNITFERTGEISIECGDLKRDANDNPVLENVIIRLNEKGMESIVTTNITLKVKMPATGWKDESEVFDCPIDHFLMISGKSINPNNSYLFGEYTGNIYARDYLNLRTNPAYASDNLRIRTNLLLVGKDINIDSGNVTFSAVDDDSIIYQGEDVDVEAQIYCQSVKIGDADVSTIETNDLGANFYLYKNLELNGKTCSFTAVGGKIYGYSSETDATPTKEPISSAIIVNGLGATLDLANLGELAIAGKAYSAFSSIDGIYNSYKDSSSDFGSTFAYYTQGESVAYRPMQVLYLIPGEYIAGVGHNPMKSSEYSANETVIKNHLKGKDAKGNANIPQAIKDLCSSDVSTPMYVTYVNGDQYVYLLWDFQDTDAAISYLSNVTKSGAVYNGLNSKQAEIINLNGGSIKLPSNAKFAGNAYSYPSTTLHSGSKAGTSGITDGCLDRYCKLMYSADRNGKSPTSGTIVSEDEDERKSVYDYLVDECDLNTSLIGQSYDSERDSFTGLRGPLEPTKDEDGNIVTYKEYASRRKYRLITGSSVNISSLEHGCTYVIISSGDVTFAPTVSGSFRGLIIAGGNISVPNSLNMECLGMLEMTPMVKGETLDTILTTEFKALLSVVVDDSVESPNTRLRKIFNVADSSGSAGSGAGDDLVTVEIDEYMRGDIVSDSEGDGE